MTKFQVTLLRVAESRKLIKKYLDERVREPSGREVYGDHLLMCSALKWYVKAAYIDLEMEGPWAGEINRFLRDRMWVGYFYLPALNGLVVEEMKDAGRMLIKRHHFVNLATGTIAPLDIPDATIKGVRGEGPELLLLSGGSWEWRLFNVQSGTDRIVSSFGVDGYVSADGAYFFPVERWSSIGLVDLANGTLLDRKNKRHFSKYATKVRIIQVLDFDSHEPSLTLLLMKKLELSYRALRDEVCVRLSLVS